MAATNHTRLRTARAAARQKSTDKSRGAAPGKSGARQLGLNRGVPPEAEEPGSVRRRPIRSIRAGATISPGLSTVARLEMRERP